MGSRQRKPLNVATRKRHQTSTSTRSRLGGCGRASTSVSDKLEALKNLIPAQNDAGDNEADQLFQQTADYILLLRTQVSVLQRLVDFYGSSPPDVVAASSVQ